jgi:hypothetical protein
MGTSLRYCDGVFAERACHRSSKFTNLYGKRGISVNLPRLCEVGLPGTKAGVRFNTFKEPVAQQLRALSTESQNKSYIASESYFGVIVPVIGIGIAATGIP